MSFRFEEFADAPSAQVAFEAAFPVGSPADLALQALVDMGAQCRSVGPAKFACRYVEQTNSLACCAWQVRIEATIEKTIDTVSLSLGLMGP